MSMVTGEVFRCYLLNRSGRIERRVDLLAGDEFAALEEATSVLNASTFRSAELWISDRNGQRRYTWLVAAEGFEPPTKGL